mgnify:CR=1 FL=1
MQRLLTAIIEARAPRLYATEGQDDPRACAHFFCALNGWDWYMTEYDPKTGEAFGYVKGFESEWGYFSIREMEGLNREKGFNVVECDGCFEPQPVSNLQ